MRATPILIGAIALAGTGLVVASSNPREPGPIQAQVQPAAPQQAPAAAAPAAAPAPAAPAQAAAPQPAAAPAFTPEQKAVADTIGAFAKVFGVGGRQGACRVLHRRCGGDRSRGQRDPRQGSRRRDVCGLVPGESRAEARIAGRGSPVHHPRRGAGGRTVAAILGQGRRFGIHALQLASGPQGRQVAGGRDSRIYRPGRGCRPVRAAPGAGVDGRPLG